VASDPTPGPANRSAYNATAGGGHREPVPLYFFWCATSSWFMTKQTKTMWLLITGTIWCVSAPPPPPSLVFLDVPPELSISNTNMAA
jgi:hypothetical protein